VDLLGALVGFEHTIKHVDDHDVKIKKAEVTKFGEVQRVKGQGMPKKGGASGFGDMVITWEVSVACMHHDIWKVDLTRFVDSLLILLRSSGGFPKDAHRQAEV